MTTTGRATFSCGGSLRRKRSAASPSSTSESWWRILVRCSASLIIIASTGLSSTSSISTGCDGPGMLPPLLRLGRVQGKQESRAFTLLGLDPDPAVVALHDLLADRQPEPAAGIAPAAVQPLEQLEHLLEIDGVDPDAVVGHGESPLRALALRLDPDARGAGAAELDRVADQVHEYLLELRGVDAHLRQRAAVDDRAAFLDAGAQVGEHVGHH